MIKKGDKVRFLNSVGGGIVRGFRDKHTALVEDESGFEFPVPVSECVVVDEGGGTARNSRSAGEERSSAVQPVELSVRTPQPVNRLLAGRPEEPHIKRIRSVFGERQQLLLVL